MCWFRMLLVAGRLNAHLDRPRLLLLAVCSIWLLFLGTAENARAGFISITVLPSDPMDTDTVVIDVSGSFPDACWGVGTISLERVGDYFNYDVYAYDGWEPGLGCPLMIVEYNRCDTVGPLGPGIYTVRVEEIVQSLRFPYGDYAALQFTVGPCHCEHQSDFDADGSITAIDLGALIDVLFAGRPDPRDAGCWMTRSDFDCDQYTTAQDLTGLIDHLFAGGEGPCDPCGD